MTGFPALGIDSAEDLANEYLQGPGTLETKVNSLINWQTARATVSGFLTGAPGLIALPATLPANLTLVLFIQLRLIAAIAYMGGHDPKSDRVKTLVLMCLTGNAASKIASSVGIQMGQKLTTQAIRAIPGRTLVAINQLVGFRLLTKFGEKGIVNLGKAVPLAGGLLGGLVEGTATKLIGATANRFFIASSSGRNQELKLERLDKRADAAGLQSEWRAAISVLETGSRSWYATNRGVTFLQNPLDLGGPKRTRATHILHLEERGLHITFCAGALHVAGDAFDNAAKTMPFEPRNPANGRPRTHRVAREWTLPLDAASFHEHRNRLLTLCEAVGRSWSAWNADQTGSARDLT